MACSPLRFPGGKGKIYPEIRKLIQENNLNGYTFVETFAGGAGLGLKLLMSGDVSRLVLNDLDKAIYALWHTILIHPEELCTFISSVPLTVEEWKKQKAIYQEGTDDLLRLGKATFFLNRTNFSGVLTGSVMGGLEQKGKYKIGARFNREYLVRQTRRICEFSGKISLYNIDATKLIGSSEFGDNALLYLDPPYVEKGPCLYRNSFTEDDHRNLASVLKDCNLPWILSYDDCELIRNIYSDCQICPLILSYSTGKTKKGEEVLVLSDNIHPIQEDLGEERKQ